MIDITLKRLYFTYYVVIGFSFLAIIFNFLKRSKCHKQITKSKNDNETFIRYGHIIGFNAFMIILILVQTMLMIYYFKDIDDKIRFSITIGSLLFLLITFVLSISYFRICSMTKGAIDPDYFRNGTLTFNIISIFIIITIPVLNFTLLSGSE